MSLEFRELVDKVHEHNSLIKNEICCIEEMSELTKILTKHLRYAIQARNINVEDLTEECGHVLLMVSAVCKTYGIAENELLSVQRDAVKRMED